MNLKEYKKIILNTTKEDWVCIGSPSYLNSISVLTDGTGNFLGIDVETFPMSASLKNDLSISIAWGFPHEREFSEPWTSRFSDPRASSDFIDFFYNRTVVFRDIIVSVDGGRCYLPLPDGVPDSKSPDFIVYNVSKEEYSFLRILDSLGDKVSEFDRYFEKAGFNILNIPWME